MPYSLAELAIKDKPFRVIAPAARDEQALLRLYTPILQEWRNSAARSMNAYVLALQTGSLAGLDDEDSDTAATVAALLALINWQAFFGKVETWHRSKWLSSVANATGVDAKWMTAAPEGVAAPYYRAMAGQATGGVVKAAREAATGYASGMGGTGYVTKPSPSLAFPVGGKTITTAINEAAASAKSLATSLSDEARNRNRQAILGGLRRGAGADEVARDINAGLAKSKKRAVEIAENELDNAVKAMTDARMAEAGLVEAAWRHYTPRERARLWHLRRDGNRYSVNDPIWSEQFLPNCRCQKRPILSVKKAG